MMNKLSINIVLINGLMLLSSMSMGLLGAAAPISGAKTINIVENDSSRRGLPLYIYIRSEDGLKILATHIFEEEGVNAISIPTGIPLNIKIVRGTGRDDAFTGAKWTFSSEQLSRLARIEVKFGSNNLYAKFLDKDGNKILN
jgi:hypothetical protein